jgi:hypothetical protein
VLIEGGWMITRNGPDWSDRLPAVAQALAGSRLSVPESSEINQDLAKRVDLFCAPLSEIADATQRPTLQPIQRRLELQWSSFFRQLDCPSARMAARRMRRRFWGLLFIRSPADPRW